MTSPMPSEPATGHQLYHGESLTPAAAVKLAFAAIGALYVTQIVLFSAGLLELVAGALSYVAALLAIVGMARRNRWGWRHFGVQRAPGAFYVAAVLIGSCLWLVNLVIVEWIDPPGDMTSLEKAVEQTHLVPTILVLGVCPSLVEELVFRGGLMRALATKLSAWNAVGISAAVFGLYHLLPPQIIAAFFTGLALGFITLRARSVLPAMLAHLLNNVWAIVISREEIPGTASLFEDHGAALIAMAAVLTAAGFALAATTQRR